MAKKKSSQLPLKLPELQEVVERIGDFMRYWGFSKIDGMVWAHIYLSPEPLSSAQLKGRLGVSKALLSLSINELLKYNVISPAGIVKHGTTLYKSVTNLQETVENVLRSRERQMLADISSASRLLESRCQKPQFNNLVSPERAKALREMCESAEVILEALILSGPGIMSLAHFNEE